MESFAGLGAVSTMLGVLVGLATIMLLLSLIVTGIVQFVQSTLRMRARNLRHGVEYVLRSTGLGGNDPKGRASDILAIPMQNDRAMRTWVNPSVTWLEPRELSERVDEVIPPVERDKGKHSDSRLRAEELLASLDEYLCKRFQLHVRIVTVLCSLLVAVLFQVSVLELVRNLSIDPGLRAKYVAYSEAALGESQFTKSHVVSYVDVSSQALDTLEKRYPKLARNLEEASGTAPTREDIIEELNTVLSESQPDSLVHRVIADYGNILDELHAANTKRAADAVRESVRRLAILDIGLWGRGPSYYRNPENCVGVLLTAIMLTFGAPFWFDRLRDLASLKDRLQPAKQPPATKT